MRRLLLHELDVDGSEATAAAAAIEAGAWSGHGSIGKELEEQLSRHFAPGGMLLLSSCTHAIELALALAEVGPGDEVIVPSYAFVSCANAVVQLGARPVFADISLDTLCLDPDSVRAVSTERTRAVLGIDYAGLPLPFERLLPLIREHEWFFIEDAAHGFGARHQGALLGTFGDAGCFSFHATKNIACGEGGALWLRHPAERAMAEQIREKGTDRTRFLQGLVDKYTWRTRGSSYVLSDILAAILQAQIKKANRINAARRHLFERYLRGFAGKVSHVPQVPKGAEPNGHLMWVRADGPSTRRDEIMRRLRRAGIDASFHYLPLHLSPYAMAEGLYRGPLVNSEGASASLIRLPLHTRLRDDDVDFIVGRFCQIAAQVG